MAFLDKFNFGKIKETVEAGVKSAQESVASIDVNAAVKGAMDAASTGIAMVGETIENVTNPHDAVETGITARDFIAIMWFLTSADGVITPEEEAGVASIANGLDQDYEAYAEELLEECRTRLKEATFDYGAQNAAKMEAEKIITAKELSKEDAKLLCWNLLAVANLDGLDQNELDFIRFVVRKASVDEAVFEELRGYSDAIVEIEAVQSELRQSDRSYAQIEPLMSEYAKREQKIIEAAQALVTDR